MTEELLLERLSRNASKYPTKDAVAFVVPDGSSNQKIERQLTYQNIENVTTSVANLLLQKGLTKGDRALLVYPPSLDFMVAFLACLKAGVVAVPVFPPNPVRKDTLLMFSTITESCGAKHALTNNTYNHMKKLSGIKDTFTKIKKNKTATWPEELQWIVTDSNSSSSNTESPATNVVPSDLAFLQYTSGSTSEPKGVMITHANLAHNLTIITNELKADQNTRVVSWLPQYHDMGLIGSYLGILYCGGSGWYLSPLSFLARPMIWIEAVSRYKATHLQAPNFAFKLTARKFNPSLYNNKSLDLSSVQHVINAAEPVDEDSINTFMNAFSPFGFKNVIYPTYGLAEHTVFVCSGGKQVISVLKKDLEVNGKVILQEEADTTKSSSAESSNGDSGNTISRLVGCGYPAHQNVIVKIVNPDTFTEVDTDCVGEIWVQSPSKAAGYYKKDEDNKELFHAMIIDGQESNDGENKNDSNDNNDGYLRTGDLGFLFKDELFICGRLKDLIIVGGRNYYPQDIEATVESASELVRPGCSAAFTIDPTQEGGEEVAVIMELREVPKDKETTCQPLAEMMRKSISAEHSLLISQIVFLRPRTVPKTTSGKIARAWCRKALVGKTLDVIYSKSIKASNTGIAPLEMEQTKAAAPAQALSSDQVLDIRAMDRKDILDKLATDVARMNMMPVESIDKKAAIVTLLDSMNISQFKGQLESGYAVKLSDEYLFRESTTLMKLVDVVKEGYAPDDDNGEGVSGTGATSNGGGGRAGSSEGTADGIAGMLGCPPGVVCCVIQ